NNPNPFGDVTNISFYLPQDEYAQLVITNVEGKVVKMIEGDFNKGLNQIKLHKAEIGAGGIYYYQLNTATESKTMKMIIIE
ncbi:MAG TPA: T9SS type A sorting domain-containing protein, partial [Saprospiraceae bacterium]|nr:T9SS type A sorting domain-containing protein [Saprospiraceae bacterium]